MKWNYIAYHSTVLRGVLLFMVLFNLGLTYPMLFQEIKIQPNTLSWQMKKSESAI